MSDNVPPYVQPPTLSNLAQTILDTASAALDANDIDGFRNRLIAPGIEFPLDVPGTVAVLFSMGHAGQIGIQQFAGMTPGEAKWTQTVAIFKVQTWAKTPVPEPKISAIAGFEPASAQAITAFSKNSLNAAFVIFAALQVAQFQNTLFPFKPALIGPLEPIGPKGQFVGYELTVQIQMP